MVIILFLRQQIKYDIFDFVNIYKGKLSKYLRKGSAPVKILIGSVMDYFVYGRGRWFTNMDVTFQFQVP